jgi:two-component system cell cycle sensor histidine kinase/response regulator CckA
MSPVWLALTAAGKIVGANAAALKLWDVDTTELVGHPFVSFIAFEIISDDPEIVQAQWEIVLSNARNQSLSLTLQSDENAPPLEVLVEIEQAVGTDFAWIAHILCGPNADQSPPPVSSFTEVGDALSLLARSDAMGFFDLDFSHDETVYSPAWKQMLGYGDADLANSYDTWLKLIHPDDSAAAPDQVGRKNRAGAHSFSVEFRMKHRRGHWVWVHCVGVQHFDESGELERVVGFHLDISERKELEEIGIVAEDRLTRLTETGGLAVFDLDFERGKAWTSPAWQKLVGNFDESPDIGLFTQYFAESEGDLNGFLAQFGTGGEWSTGLTSLRSAHDSSLKIVLGLRRQISRRGELHHIIGFATQLEDGEHSETSETGALGTLNRAALNILNEGLILTDDRGKIVAVNSKSERLTGVPAAVAIGQSMKEVFRLVTTVDGRSADDALDQALATDTASRLYVDYSLAADGIEPRPIVWAARLLLDDQKKAAGIAIVFRDPEEMSLSPEELIRANRFESLGQLAGGMAHDFNNLLSTILGAVSIAKENRDYDKLDEAETACMAAKTLTRQLLQFSKGDSGGDFSVMKPSDVVRDAIRVASSGSPVKFETEFEEAAGPVEADRGQLIQIFQNLIINARQAMDDQYSGIITIRMRNLTLRDDQAAGLAAGDYVQIEVQDNGSGIPEDKIDRIFEPFFTTKKTGTGLGLATVLSIVRKHGGQLGVASTVGSGTTFTVFLPVTEKSLAAAIRRPPSLRFGTGRVLVMDDDKQLCDITRMMLEGLDYKVDVAHKGEDALTLYRRYYAVDRPYDAVLLDLTIVGGMGGEETFRQLREIDSEVRAIVSSGHDNDEMARQFLAAGFCGYLTKPYRVADLSKIIKAIAGR